MCLQFLQNVSVSHSLFLNLSKRFSHTKEKLSFIILPTWKPSWLFVQPVMVPSDRIEAMFIPARQKD